MKNLIVLSFLILSGFTSNALAIDCFDIAHSVKSAVDSYKKGQLITKFKTMDDHTDPFRKTALEECKDYKNDNNLGPRFFCKNISSSNYFYSEDARASSMYPNPGGMRENKEVSFHYAELRERGSLVAVRVYCKRMNQCTKNTFGGLDFSDIIAQYCVNPSH